MWLCVLFGAYCVPNISQLFTFILSKLAGNIKSDVFSVDLSKLCMLLAFKEFVQRRQVLIQPVQQQQQQQHVHQQVDQHLYNRRHPQQQPRGTGSVHYVTDDSDV
jgi:hypothetical protein